MPLPLRWTPKLLDRRARLRSASISAQLGRLLLAAGLLLGLLIVAQFAALTVNRVITARLVEERITPMSQLQTIASAYQTSWAIADKVRIGTIDATGGGTAPRHPDPPARRLERTRGRHAGAGRAIRQSAPGCRCGDHAAAGAARFGRP